MSTKTTNAILLGLIILSVVTGLVLYPLFPDLIASHWNSAGQVNGTMGKFWGVFLFPLIMAGLFALYAAIPRIDPLRTNIESFRKHYNPFWVFMFVFFAYVFGLTIIWNLGMRFNFTVAIVPAVAALFLFLGAFLKKLKRNWFVGIRTPWTLSSDIVWEKTHRIGGILFQATGLVMLLGILLPEQFLWLIFVPLLATVLYTVIYSYVEYKKLARPHGT